MHKLINDGLTYDDVLVVPRESDLTLENIDTSTNLTKQIRLNTPIVSSGMDTVTESRMAITVARQGGIGIIHSNMSIEQQASEVDKVKRSEHGVITDPFSLSPNHYVYEANELMSRYHISGVPIIENSKLIGIITNRDLRFETNHNKKIYEVMTKDNLVTAPEGTTLDDAKDILTTHKIEKLPIVDENFMLKGLITIKDIEKSIKYPNASKDDQGRLLVGAVIIVTPNTDNLVMMKRVEALIEAKVDVIMLDSPNGHSKILINAIMLVKETYPSISVIAGGVATKEGAKSLIDAGADCIKVGFGTGSVSTTRVISGVGVPQVTAIYECAEIAKKYDIPVIAGGGIKYSGDITKAIVAGASSVMIGGLLAGCKESPGEMELFQGRKYKVYRGTGSTPILENTSHNTNNNMKNRISKIEPVPEAVEGRVSYKGNAKGTLQQLIGGLRVGMSYCGTKTVDELKEVGQFIKVSNAGLKESHPHDILITNEAPNYSVEY